MKELSPPTVVAYFFDSGAHILPCGEEPLQKTPYFPLFLVSPWKKWKDKQTRNILALDMICALLRICPPEGWCSLRRKVLACKAAGQVSFWECNFVVEEHFTYFSLVNVLFSFFAGNNCCSVSQEVSLSLRKRESLRSQFISLSLFLASSLYLLFHSSI